MYGCCSEHYKVYDVEPGLFHSIVAICCGTAKFQCSFLDFWLEKTYGIVRSYVMVLTSSSVTVWNGSDFWPILAAVHTVLPSTMFFIMALTGNCPPSLSHVKVIVVRGLPVAEQFNLTSVHSAVVISDGSLVICEGTDGRGDQGGGDINLYISCSYNVEVH